MIQLYGYFQSSAAYRARIALNLKDLDYELVAIHLTKDGGHQFTEEYTKLNPQQLVPAIIDGDVTLTQSMAIMEYLEEAYPDHPILPADPAGRARVRSLSQIVACDIHPLNNLRVRKYIVEDFGLTQDRGQTWQEHWINRGFAAYETMLAGGATFSHGDTPTMADICLIPQMFNARRINMDISAYPNLLRIEEACNALPAFERAHPKNQPDAG